MMRYLLYSVLIVWATIFSYHNNMPSFADDPGIGWHLKTGEWIAENQAVPHFDPFLVGGADRQWICDQWLSDLFFFSSYKIGSWQFLYFVLFLLFLTSYFLILYKATYHFSHSQISTLASIALCFKSGLVHFILRPTIIGIFLFCLLFSWLTFRDKHKKYSLRDLLFIFALFCAWSNLHPSFFTGLALLVVYLFADIRRLPGNILFLVVAFGATLVNPNGFALHESIISLSRSDFFMHLNQEWREIDLMTGAGQVWMYLTFIPSGAFIVSKHFRQKIGIFHLTTILLFGVLSLKSVRLLPYYGIVACPVIALALSSIASLPFFEKFHFLKKMHLYFRVREGAAGKFYALLMVLLSCLYLSQLKSYGPSRELYPYELVAYMNSKRERNFAVLATPDYGGFLTFYLQNGKAVIDDRNTLLGEEMYKEYLGALRDPQKLLNFMKQHRANYYLTRKNIKSGSASPEGGLLREVCLKDHCLYRK